MFKETKRTSSVQPSRMSAVSPRKLMSSKAGNLISGKSKALSDVLDGLFKLQIYAKVDCNMFKETKRTSSVQPSRMSAVSPRKLMSSKAGSTSPVRMQTGKKLVEKFVNFYM
ncbi:hypothetical protein AHF37_00997 [Paragonimus kellicotti]|nr:hypothetical protein AHF37_00997 [Paragonimus kellicotti]